LVTAFVENRTAVLWNLAPLWTVLVVVIVIAAVIAYRWRARSARVPPRIPEPAPPEADDELDSSHIGFAPLVRSGLQQAPLDAGAPARGEDAGGTRR
jgi:hypothetical protein